jgi:uncharacterized RDD family membrane protein YckC
MEYRVNPYLSPPKPTFTTMNTIYAGFWLRFVAWFIDVLLLGIIGWIIIAPILATVGLASNFSFSDFQNTEDVAALIGVLSAMIGLSWAVNEVIKILYHSFMESSKYQGSVGKMALGLMVTDLQGQRLDFGKALVRNLCKLISNLTFTIGYIMAGFTEKQQALHDVIAGALVVKKQPELTPNPIR